MSMVAPEAMAQADGDSGPPNAGLPDPARAARAFHLGRLPPTALLLLSILSVQLGSALATLLFASIGPVGTTFVSTLFAALLLSLASVSRRSAAVPGQTGSAVPGSSLRLRRHHRLILLFGLVYCLMALPAFLALRTIPLGVVATITFLGPLGLAVATSRRPIHFLWIAVAGFGVVMLAPEIGGSHDQGLDPHQPVFQGLSTNGLDPLGLCYAAVAALAWAGFVPLSKRTGAIFPGVEGLALALWVSVGLLLPLALLEGKMAGAGIGDLAGSFGVALLGVVLPMAMEYRALQRMSARTYGILVTLEPAMGALIGVVCLSQPAGPRMLFAVGCVMLAALGITLSDRSEAD
jgi:inner membrane transporter RhtA